MATRPAPRVFSIPSGAPFLPVLAEALLARRLVPFGDDPLDLAGVTVLLPTRRAVRAFRDELVRQLGANAAILPAIRPIGDIDEEEHLLDPATEPPGDRVALPRAIPALTRRLVLTRLVLAWGRAMRRHPLELSRDEPLRIPGNASDAAYLAGDLSRLIDDMTIGAVTAADLARLAPDDHAEYFRLTLQFLQIVTEQWPAHLAERRQVDAAARRDTLIRAAADRINKGGSRGPIVAAGSTGSIPATAALLATIAAKPNGAVVLPGLDRQLDPAGWDAIGAREGEVAADAHPQFGLKQLIGEIGVARDEVAELGVVPGGIVARTRLLSEALRPAATLEAWTSFKATTDALAGIDLLVARNEQEEATAIALALREAIETPGATAALVTPDRTIARRVAAELARWNLAVDDSAGAPLAREPHGVFARLLIEAVTSDADPVTLLSLLKHPLAAFRMERAMCRRAARKIELALFRGRRTMGGIAGLTAALAASRAKVDDGDRDIPPARRRLSPHDWELAATLAARVTEILGPLEVAFRQPQISAAEAARLLIPALVAAATDQTGRDTPLAEGEGGKALATLLGGLAEDTEAPAVILAPGDLAQFLQALMAGATVTRPVGPETRIHIWGTLEARLQSADVVILGGLDEGIWPAATRTDPWLSRAMRAELKLPPPERRTGLAAHDFVQGLAGGRVIVTRAEKRGGAPMVESRWLQRIRALAGKDEATAMTGRGARYVGWARALNHVPKADVKPLGKPRPKPPVAVRPKRLSITEVEKLIRDPYAIYAKHILRLDPLDPLGREPDAALRGTLIHKALGDFTTEWRGDYDVAAEARLKAIARDVLSVIADYPDTWSVWTIRFAAIANWFMLWETSRSGRVAERNAEVGGTLEFRVSDGVFTLRGRADRIDLMRDNTVEIYDFKTGTPQTERTVFAGLTPQMTLEAAMVTAGGFDAEIAKLGRRRLAGLPIARLAWLAVGNAGRNDVEKSAVGQGESADRLAERARAMFADLVMAFDTPDHPYASRTRPMTIRMQRYQSDYDHLARVREWSLLESEAEATG